MPISGDINFFFAEPTVPEKDHERAKGEQSVLYLLRREAQGCLFAIRKIHPEEELLKRIPERRLFASSMVLFAGIDLLAKFFCEDHGKVGVRFICFGCEYLGLSEDEASALWDVRNAIMHSFGLYVSKGHKVSIEQTCGHSRCRLVRKKKEGWRLCVGHLYPALLGAIESYKRDLDANKGDLRERFERMFPKYGSMIVKRGTPLAHNV
jgi:hypothetical protein